MSLFSPAPSPTRRRSLDYTWKDACLPCVSLSAIALRRLGGEASSADARQHDGSSIL